MASTIIDASLASAWCFPDEQTDFTKAVFHAVFSSALDAPAPRLWAYEIRNSVLMGCSPKADWQDRRAGVSSFAE